LRGLSSESPLEGGALARYDFVKNTKDFQKLLCDIQDSHNLEYNLRVTSIGLKASLQFVNAISAFCESADRLKKSPTFSTARNTRPQTIQS
jgi:hypothetical protein